MLYFSAVWGTFHRFSLETSGSALCEGTRLYKEKGGEKITAVYFKFEIEFGWQICENAAHGCVLCGPPTHSHTHTESDIDFDCVGVRWTDWNFASAALSSLSDYSLRWERSRLLFQWTFMSSFYLMCRGWCVAPWSVGWSFFSFSFFFCCVVVRTKMQRCAEKHEEKKKPHHRSDNNTNDKEKKG